VWNVVDIGKGASNQNILFSRLWEDDWAVGVFGGYSDCHEPRRCSSSGVVMEKVEREESWAQCRNVNSKADWTG